MGGGSGGAMTLRYMEVHVPVVVGLCDMISVFYGH